MSRLRSTIDSVTKAVGGTDLISRFSRFKPGGGAAERAPLKAETSSSNDGASGGMKEKAGGENGEGQETNKQREQARENPFVAQKRSPPSVASGANTPALSSSSAVGKQTMQLFHPTATNMDETYTSLSNHINSYFGQNAHGEDGENKQQPVSEHVPQVSTLRTADHIPVLSPVSGTKSTDVPTTSPPSQRPGPGEAIPSFVTQAGESAELSSSTKKGFSHYLSDPRPSVQAFVGSYISKFRGDPKKVAVDEGKSSSDGVAGRSADGAPERTDDEKEKAKQQQLLSQREKVGVLKCIHT